MFISGALRTSLLSASSCKAYGSHNVADTSFRRNVQLRHSSLVNKHLTACPDLPQIYSISRLYDKYQNRRYYATHKDMPSPPQPDTGPIPDVFAQTFEELEKKEREEEKTIKKKGRKGKRVRQADEAWCIVKGIKGSIKKVNSVCKLIRGLLIPQALIQLSLCERKAAKMVYKGVLSARANAINNHKLNADRMIVSEARCGRETPLKRIRYHNKGRMGRVHKRRTRVTIILKELPATDERLLPPKVRKLNSWREKQYLQRQKKKERITRVFEKAGLTYNDYLAMNHKENFPESQIKNKDVETKDQSD